MKKICLHPTDIQTRRRKKIFYFSLFLFIFLTDLELPDRAFININWQVISSPLRKCAYIRLICKPGDKKNYIDFFLFFLLYFNRLNITRSGRQKYQLTGNFEPLKKMRLHPTDMLPRRQKKITIFPYLCLFFLNWLSITRSSRQKYELTGNFKSFKKMNFYPTDMQTRQQKIKFRFFHIFLYFF